MSHRCFAKFACLSFVCFLSTGILAQDHFPAGAESKSVGMGSPILSHNGPAVLYNPALLSRSQDRIIPYLELGYGNISHSYEHPDFDQVSVNVGTMIGTVGAAGKIVDAAGWGVVIFPKASGKQTIDGLPRRISGTYEPLYVESESEIFDVGLGGAYSVLPNLAFGVSVILTSEKRKLNATQVGEDSTLIKLDAKGTFLQPVLGLTYTPSPMIDLGFSARAGNKKSYSGSQKAASSEETTSPKSRNFEPRVYSLGAMGTWQEWFGAVHLNYQTWGDGRSEYREGLTSSTSNAELSDIFEWSLSAGYTYTGWTTYLTYGVLPSPWGDGHYAEDLAGQKSGADFGVGNNMDRTFWGMGLYGNLSDKIRLTSALHRSAGDREVAPDGDKPGYYQVEVFTITGGAEIAF